MADTYAEAGNYGSQIRSDCWVGFTAKKTGGITLNLESKVDVLYGDSIRKLFMEMLSFFEIEHAQVDIKDSGAVPFVLMARFESAIKKLGLDKGKIFLPDWAEVIPKSTRDRFRRSRLYLPGDQPKANAQCSNPPAGWINPRFGRFRCAL